MASFESLTRRERQVMALITDGLMNKQVAGKIGISEMTVKIHRGNLMKKMHAKSLAELVEWRRCWACEARLRSRVKLMYDVHGHGHTALFAR